MLLGTHASLDNVGELEMGVQRSLQWINTDATASLDAQGRRLAGDTPTILRIICMMSEPWRRAVHTVARVRH